jgi:hypothetical protein
MVSYRDKQGISEAENGEKTENLAGTSGQKPQHGEIYETRESENMRFTGENTRKNQKANPERVRLKKVWCT